MAAEQQSTVVTILDKEYRVVCDPQQQDTLQQAADVLDQKMRDIRKNGKIVGVDRIAIMAALNLTYDLLGEQQQNAQLVCDARKSLSALGVRIDAALEATTESA